MLPRRRLADEYLELYTARQTLYGVTVEVCPACWYRFPANQPFRMPNQRTSAKITSSAIAGTTTATANVVTETPFESPEVSSALEEVEFPLSLGPPPGVVDGSSVRG